MNGWLILLGAIFTIIGVAICFYWKESSHWLRSRIVIGIVAGVFVLMACVFLYWSIE